MFTKPVDTMISVIIKMNGTAKNSEIIVLAKILKWTRTNIDHKDYQVD